MTHRRGSAPAGWFPKRGEVCLTYLDKVRPAIIISSNLLNRHALDVCGVPISTTRRHVFSLRPKLKAGTGGLDRESWAKCDQVITVEKASVAFPPLGLLDSETLERIAEAIRQALEL